MRTVTHLLAVLFFALAACGGDQINSNVGTSSNSLLVQATVTSSPALGIQNPATADQFKTEIVVRVWKYVGIQRIGFPGATVKIKAGSQEYVLQPGTSPELYRNSFNGGLTNELVTLNVDAGADFVHNVQRKAPGIQVITSPTKGQSVSIGALAGAPLPVTWTRPTAADVAELNVSNYQQQVPDTGTVNVPAANLQTGDNQTVRLDRTNSVQANSLAGSNLQVTIEQRLDFNLVP